MKQATTNKKRPLEDFLPRKNEYVLVQVKLDKQLHETLKKTLKEYGVSLQDFFVGVSEHYLQDKVSKP